MGRLDEALSQMQRAVELDPLSAAASSTLAYLHYARGEHDLAIAQYRRAMELDSGWYFPHYLLAATHTHMGNLQEALAEAQTAYELSGHNAIILGLLGYMYGLAGRHSEARALLDDLIAQGRTTYVSTYAVASIYFGLGEEEQAFDWYEKAVEERDLNPVCALKTEPLYMRYYGHPRYHALLRKMNLEP